MNDRFATHDVENQAPPLAPYDLWATDRALREGVRPEGGGWGEAQLAAYGPVAGGELMELGFAANENRPKLKAFDRYGHRLDEVPVVEPPQRSAGGQHCHDHEKDDMSHRGRG